MKSRGRHCVSDEEGTVCNVDVDGREQRESAVTVGHGICNEVNKALAIRSHACLYLLVVSKFEELSNQ